MRSSGPANSSNRGHRRSEGEWTCKFIELRSSGPAKPSKLRSFEAVEDVYFIEFIEARNSRTYNSLKLEASARGRLIHRRTRGHCKLKPSRNSRPPISSNSSRRETRGRLSHRTHRGCRRVSSYRTTNRRSPKSENFV